jgi:phage terminase small subunit
MTAGLTAKQQAFVREYLVDLNAADYVLTGIREIAERCLQRAPVMVGRGDDRKQLVDDEGRHVWTFDSSGANKAFESLGKHLKLFTEKHEHTGSVGLNLSDADLERIAANKS